ncbi:MAG TPA: response regulator, partial [Pirellulales bacterium]|nr:response regulator [Pirellulales bacterium]
LEEDEDDQELPATEREASDAKPGETVLVVEDDQVVRGLVVELLTELGYQVIDASDGQGGIAILNSPQRLDLLITDIGLPDVNGRDVASAGRLARPELKVLFMTAYAERATQASGFLEHGMGLITKPFEMTQLAHRVQEIITAPHP